MEPDISTLHKPDILTLRRHRAVHALTWTVVWLRMAHNQRVKSMVGMQFGRYRVLEKIGAGGMGEVYRARDEQLERDVALKILPATSFRDPDARSRLLREARSAAALNHPHICTIHEVGEAEGQAYIAMELVEGQSLSARLTAGALPAGEVLRYGIQLAEALAHAHERSIVHRDLKCANVVMSSEGRAKVLDFGLAKRLSENALDEVTRSQASLTQPGAVVGTLAYMAPEQLRAQPADARSDIWALGVMLYEMATGLRPFQGKTGFELSSSILNQPPLSLPEKVPVELRAVINRCLEKEPDRRYQRAGEVRAALETLQTGATVPLSGVRFPRVQRPWLALVAGAVVLAAILGGMNASRLREWFQPATKPAAPTTLAVLPLQVLTEKEKIGYLGVGISDAIITRLANISQLRVRPTSSILRYKDQPADVQEAGKTLNAENVLSGTLQQVGPRLRVSVQLVRISDGAPLWGHQFDLAQQDLLSLQDQLADKVTTALKIQATAAERERVYRRYTQNAEAYDSYLRGRAHLAYDESVRTAVESFERALQLEPNYALAHAGLAYASGVMYNNVAADAERKQWGERAEQEARAALAIAPDLAEAHEALASYYQLTEFKWDRTIEESRRALELNPALDHPHTILAGTYLHVGFLDMVEPETRAAKELNPGGFRGNAAVLTGVAALWGARFAEALPLLEQGYRETIQSPLVAWNLGNAYFYVGRRQQAEQLLAGVKRGNEPDIRAQAALASFLAARGERVRAEAIIKQVQARPSFEHHAMYSAGATYAQLGRPAEAVRMLRQARDTGFFCFPWYERDPLLKPLQHDLEFQKFMQEFRREWEAFRARYAGGQ